MNDPTHSRYRYLAFKDNGIFRRYVRQDNDKNLLETGFSGKAHPVPAHGSYGALLFDPRWKQRRAEILHRDGNRCVICGQRENLHIHHRQYHFLVRHNQFKAPWDYKDHLLITLCESCHSRGHSKYKVTTINV